MKYITTSFLLIFALSLYAQQYTPVPEKVSGINKSTFSLNGKWQFNTAPEKDFWKSGTTNDWKEIEVPGEWVMQGFNVEPRERAAYVRKFNMPANWNNKNIILRCDAIYSDAIIWINGEKVGSHLGGFNAFEFNITSLIKSGENTISIGVMSESFNDTLASATQYAAHQLGGITRKIYLFAIPEAHISGLDITTHFDDEYKDAELRIKFRIKNNSTSNLTGTKLHITLTSPSGKPVQLENNEIELPEIISAKEIEKEIVFEVQSPEQWDAEHPNLYTLTVELENGKEKEIVTQKVGFRQIEVIGSQVFLNGKPIKLRGANRHEVHPLRGRSLTDELWKKDAELFKKANCNYIRTSHYPPAEEFIAYCDSIGLFVELEAPFCWVGHAANIKFKDKDSLEDTLGNIFKSTLIETIEFYRNHPSIIIWSMANESAWTDQWSEIKDYINVLDPSRPKAFHDQSWGTWNNYASTTAIANIHYPGPDGPAYVKKYQRPILFGEYTHLNTYNRKEIATDPGVRDAWGRGFETMWDNMYYSTGCLGGAIWSGVDDVFYLPEGKAVGYGEWGPIDGWRREKPEYWHLKKTYSPVKIYNKNIKLPEMDEPIILQIENRYDFTNLNECSIEWTIGDERGELKPDIEPRNFGFAKLLPENKNLEGKMLNLKVYDSYNNLVDEYNISIGENKTPVNPYKCIDFDKFSLKKGKRQIVVSNENFKWIFNAESGMIEKAVIGENEVLTGGCTLMLLPLTTGPCKTEHSLEVSVLNDLCTMWKADSVDAKESEEGIVVHVKGSYQEAEGSVIYLFKANGEIVIDYQFKAKIEIDPRQIGLVYTCNRVYETLNWERKGQWTAYPENHIGRTKGEAKLFEEGKYEFKFGKQPEWDWRFDSNFLGTNDFRSTKDYIYWASLTSNTGNGLVVLSDGDDSFRAFADKSNISFMVAGFVTGGSDMFYAAHLKNERKKLNVGDEFKGSFKMKFVKKKL
jgi:beta-galactosidase